MHKYNFKLEECPYREVCNLVGTNDCTLACPRFLEVDYLFGTSNMPKAMQQPFLLTPETCDYGIYDKLLAIKENILEEVKIGLSLFLYSSNVGNGKTSWGIKLMQSYIDAIWNGNCLKQRVLFVHVPTFFRKKRESISKKDIEFETMIENIDTLDLIVWDEISSKALTEYEHEMLLSYLDQRIANGKSNIYTANLHGDKLVTAIGNRLASRIENNSICLEFKGKDRRGKR